ncbi:hypothetical protein CMQ_4628 [Grosmannia clavigera kw1407]|uniref:Ubiquitin-like domain-containing protein n=1 Tax=Grosmannia clavigera (strain kw1407 / UAMH 11150) TaxID=655863 RepID=F0XTH0_GROCL|nr:uncharacterized protein CMQ_4628 [Grosmannia clavigera kw1407]EFW98776.1 hypothetical protein CMQ_4628 [Grosmannia clavigera kw1407]
MSELQFVRSFLGSLDGLPLKLSADYMEDAKGYPARPPYILPRMAKPMKKTSETRLPPGQERCVVVSVKSLHRSPPLDLQLGALPLATTSLLDLRQQLATKTHVPIAKLKLLFGKKPVADTKVLKDLIGPAASASATTLELGLMVVGGAATVAAATQEAEEETKTAAPPPAAAPPPVAVAAAAPPPSGQAVVESEAFWSDLRAFLVARINDDKLADELFSSFLRAWDERPSV